MPRAVTIAALCASLIALPGCAIAQPASEAPEESTPDYAAMAREVIRSHQVDPEGENGWGELLQAVYRAEGALALLAADPVVQAWLAQEGFEEEKRTIHDGGVLLDACRNRPELVGAVEHEAIAAFVAHLEETGLFKSFDALLQHECFVPRLVSPLQLERAGPHLGAARAFSRLCAVRMLDAHRRGDDDAVVQSCGHLLAAARAASSDVGVLPRLVSTAMYHVTADVITDIALSGTMSANLAAQLSRLLDENALLDVEVAIETERLAILDTIALTYARVGGNVRAAAAEQGAAAALFGEGAAALTLGTEPEAQRLANDYMDGLSASMSDEEAERAAGIEKMKTVNALCDDDNGPMHVQVVCMVLPAAGKFRMSERRLEAMQRGVRTLLAIEQFRMTEGRPPATLDELVPRCLPAVFADPYAEGAPLQYRVLEEGEAGPEGQTYILYTVGGDGEDNGGAAHPEPVNALSPAPSGKGYDYVFNVSDR